MIGINHSSVGSAASSLLAVSASLPCASISSSLPPFCVCSHSRASRRSAHRLDPPRSLFRLSRISALLCPPGFQRLRFHPRLLQPCLPPSMQRPRIVIGLCASPSPWSRCCCALVCMRVSFGVHRFCSGHPNRIEDWRFCSEMSRQHRQLSQWDHGSLPVKVRRAYCNTGALNSWGIKPPSPNVPTCKATTWPRGFDRGRWSDTEQPG